MEPSINWSGYRREDNTIDLVKAFIDYCLQIKMQYTGDAIRYLHMIELLQPIYSRQTAAVTIANAIFQYSKVI